MRILTASKRNAVKRYRRTWNALKEIREPGRLCARQKKKISTDVQQTSRCYPADFLTAITTWSQCVEWPYCQVYIQQFHASPRLAFTWSQSIRETPDNVLNPFKVDGNDTRVTSTSFWCHYCELWRDLTEFSGVSVWFWTCKCRLQRTGM